MDVPAVLQTLRHCLLRAVRHNAPVRHTNLVFTCSEAAFLFHFNNSSHVNWPLHIAGILPGIRCILDAIDFPYNIFFIKGFSIYFDCSRTGRWIYHCQTYKIVFLRTIERPLFASCWFLLDSNLLFFHLMKSQMILYIGPAWTRNRIFKDAWFSPDSCI